VSSGYWRLDYLTTSMLECPMGANACRGGVLPPFHQTHTVASVLSSSYLCHEGYMGPLCDVCEDNYYYDSASNTCNVCTKNGPKQLVLMIISTAIIVIVGVLFVMGFMCSSDKIFNFILNNCSTSLINNVASVSIVHMAKNPTELDLPIPKHDAIEAVENILEAIDNDVIEFGEAFSNIDATDKLKIDSAKLEVSSKGVDSGASKDEAKSMWQKIQSKLKIIITVYQIISSLQDSLNIKYPVLSSKLLNTFR
jgi:hypothetical protein